MKRVLWAATVVVLVLGALGLGQIREDVWARLPDTEKLAFRVQDAGGRTTLSISAFILTCANLRAFTDDPAYDCQVVDLMTSLFGGRTPMFVFVGNPSGTAQSFSPTTFVFRQGGRQWGLGGDDFFEMHAPFSGSIPSGTVGSGFIAIPAQVDLAEPFRLEYGSAFGVLSPRPGEQPGLPPVVTPPVDPPPVVTPAAPIRVPQDHATVSAAVRVAQPGGEIELARGTYREDVTITKPLTIRGEAGAILEGTVRVLSTSNVQLSRVEVRGTVELRNVASFTLEGVVVKGSPRDGLLIEGGSGMVVDSTVEDARGAGVNISFGAQVSMNATTIRGSTGAGVIIALDSRARIWGSTIEKNQGDGVRIRASTADISGSRVVENSGFGIHADDGSRVSGEDNVGWANARGPGADAVPELVWPAMRVPQDFTTLREALGQVPRGSQGTLILLAAGTHAGGVYVNAGLILRGEGAERSVIEAATWQGDSLRGITIVSAYIGHEFDVVLENLTVTGGTGSWGSAIHVEGAARATIHACSITESTRGISIQEDAHVTVSSSTIARNGVGIIGRSTQAITVVDTVVTQHDWERGRGMLGHGAGYGIYLEESKQVTITGCEVSENHQGLRLQGDATISRSTISANAWVGIFATRGQVTIRECSISGNNTGIEAGGQATVIDCAISDNETGIYLTRAGTLIAINGNTVTGNTQAGIIASCPLEATVVGTGNAMYDNGVDLRGNLPGTLRTPLVPATETRIVYPDPRYPSLQHTVDALVPGGRLILQGGEHTAGLTISKEVEIEAQPGETVVLRARNPETAVLSLVGGAELTMTGLTLSGGEHGLFLAADARATVRACIVTENEIGIELKDQAEVVIEHTAIHRNRGSGIVVGYWQGPGGARAAVHKCDISGNGAAGVVIENRNYGSVTQSVISGNGAAGITVRSGAEARIEGNRITGNQGYGVSWLRPHAGRVTGSRNTIPGPYQQDGNRAGGVDPTRLSFLLTREGGEHGTGR